MSCENKGKRSVSKIFTIDNMSLQRRLSNHELASHENLNDMTSDLSSLNFETALSVEELRYVSLRARHHCFSVTSCAYAVYFVSTFNELRHTLSEMRNPINKKTIKFLKQTVPRNAIKVGIIGCGRLGKQIISCLLAFCDVKTEEIIISTRRPNLLSSFRKAGITCVSDNKHVVSTCNLVFLCCLPSHVPTVAEDIAGHVSNNCIICSYVTGISLPRLKQLFRHHGITKIEYTWSINNAEKPWCLGDDVVNALKKEHIAELIYPLSTTHKESSIVWSSPKMIETIIYGCLNMCPTLEVTTDEALYLINIVFLGTTESEKKLGWSDILDADSLMFVESGNLPVFDLFHIGTQDTPLTTILLAEEKRKLLLQKYLAIFNQLKNPS